METEWDEMRTLAVRLAAEAGRYAVEELEQNLGIEAKGSGADVVTRVDREVERRIVDGILRQFPDHAILGEESGQHGEEDAPVRWLVDPLDGTNNYVMGLPMFGVCITACVDNQPVVAVVHDSVRDITTSAVQGGGAFRGARRLALGAAPGLKRTTLSWTQGYAVPHDDPFRARAMEAMERSAKRVLRTWSPSIDWGLVATGHVGAFVAYRNELWDLLGGALIVEEAGGVISRVPELDLFIVGHAQTVSAVRSLLDL